MMALKDVLNPPSYLHHFTHINIPRDFSITVVLKLGLDLGVLIAAGVIIVT